MSEWVISRLLPSTRERLDDLIARMMAAREREERSLCFAEILDLFASLSRQELAEAIAHPPRHALDPYWSNYLAATIEQAAAAQKIRVPAWVLAIPPLTDPAFGSELASLRLHLLVAAPPPFAARNLFIDTALGGRV